jgi:glycosyltransferase involved in cell wall biosynthesis
MISIVLPVHNQASHIGAVVTEYSAAVDRLNHPYELILVPNACHDGSEEVCRTLSAERGDVRMVALANRGWGLAVRAGLAAASGDVLCYTNSARTTGEMLFLFLAYGLAYRDVVIKANRRIRDGLVRRAGSLLYNLECRALFDLACWDINGTPKVFPASLRPLVELTRDDDLIDLEFVVACRRHDYRLLEVPILSTRRKGGKSTTNVHSAVAMYAGAIQMWRQERPS